jgi:hypothetical protein
VPWLAWLFWVTVALLIDRPFQEQPLPIRDWAGAMAILGPTDGVQDAYRALMGEFASEGRFQPAFMAGFAAQWAVFGTGTIGWQTVRFLLFVALFLAMTVLARDLGSSPVAAAVAVGLWLVVSGGREAWSLLQVAEPVAALFITVAALAAIRASGPRRTVMTATAALALVLGIWSKETAIVAAPFIVGLLAFRRDGEWSWRSFARPGALVQVAVIALAVAAALLPILRVRSHASSLAYGSRFDVAGISVSRLMNAVSAIVLPVTREWWFPANIVFLGLLIAGWMLLIRRAGPRHVIALVVLLAFPLCGAVLYSAWPAFPGYYALPFAISMGALFAIALTTLWGADRIARLAASGGVAVIVLYGSVLAWNGAAGERSIRTLDYAAVQMTSRMPPDRPLVVGVPDPARSGGVARGLLLYARAIGSERVPSQGQDWSCDDALRASESDSGYSVVLFSHLCDLPADQINGFRLTTSHASFSWRTFLPEKRVTAVAIRFAPQSM